LEIFSIDPEIVYREIDLHKAPGYYSPLSGFGIASMLIFFVILVFGKFFKR